MMFKLLFLVTGVVESLSAPRAQLRRPTAAPREPLRPTAAAAPAPASSSSSSSSPSWERWPAGCALAGSLASWVTPQAAFGDSSVLVETGDVSKWAASLGSQDKVALVVLGFLVVFVIPALVSDLLETQKDPAAAIAKKQQRLKDLENKYSFLPAAKADDGPPPTPEEQIAAEKKAAKRAAENDEADDLIASVNALTSKK